MTRHLLGLPLILLLGCPGGSADDKTGVDTADTADITWNGGDEDGDGYAPSDGDCDETNAEVNPGVEEVCDGLDNNCDGSIDEGAQTEYFQDADGDGFGDAAASTWACEPGEGYVTNSEDCDDAEARSYPGNTEVCDEIDNNCDGSVDEGVTFTFYPDADEDGFGDALNGAEFCEMPEGYVANGDDCDDASNKAYPGNVEVCDEIDNNCDGQVDEGVETQYYQDVDADGFGDAGAPDWACSLPTGYSANADDCDDNNEDIFPGATELCNGFDDNCDGVTDENTAADASTWYADNDTDGYGDAGSPSISCSAPFGYVADSTDCDDTNAAVNPVATEICDGIDNNCDGLIDDDSAADVATWYADTDGDSFGNAAASDIDCEQPAGYVADNTDCNDTASSAYPGGIEVCDSLDNDCDGTVDEDDATDAGTWYADTDGDAYGDAAVSRNSCTQPAGYVANDTDCDDTRATSYPGATEYCNGYDDNCDGTVDEDTAVDATTWYADSDVDGYGNPAVTDVECYVPAGYVADNTDCDDTRALTNPGATEWCNTIDDDCNGIIDDDYASDASTWYADSDSDTYGNPSVSDVECNQPAGYVADSTDCDDTNDINYPGADEICDSMDNDCDGAIDEDGGVSDGTTYYLDSDTDGFGDENNTLLACDLPSGYADNYWDCDDSDPTEPVAVDTSGSASGAGTIGDPLDTIQGGVNLADACVVVMPGTYTESSIDMGGKSIDVWGVDGWETTVVDAGLTTCDYSTPYDCEPVFDISSGTGAVATIHGFWVKGGTGYVSASTSSTTCADSDPSSSGDETCTVSQYDYCGGGAYVDGDDPMFSDIVFEDNDLPEFDQVSTGSWTQTWIASMGGGVCLMNSNAQFDGVTFVDNFADAGGGLFMADSSSITLVHGIFDDNSASDGAAIAASDASSTIENSIVTCNNATVDGGGLFTESSGSHSVINTTWGYNTGGTASTNGSTMYIGASTTLVLWNTIGQGNTTSPMLMNAGTATIAYADVVNAGAGGATSGTWTSSSVTADGGQVNTISCDGNPWNDDASLASGASGIDAGDPSSSYNDVDGTPNDLGAFGGPGGEW